MTTEQLNIINSIKIFYIYIKNSIILKIFKDDISRKDFWQ